MEYKKIKEALQKELLQMVDDQLKTAQDSLEEAFEAVKNDTKSTAGDKHETGRAMAQLEQEKAGKIIQVAKQNRNRVVQLPMEGITKVSFGAVVITDKANFYISLAMGKISLNNELYFSVSANAPIVQAMIGKTVDESFVFNGVKQHILKIY